MAAKLKIHRRNFKLKRKRNMMTTARTKHLRAQFKILIGEAKMLVY